MYFFPKILSLHNETKKPMGIPTDEDEWPDSWKIVEFKEYPRMQKFQLPHPANIDSKFQDVLLTRQSRRMFNSRSTLQSDELSSLLFWSSGIRKNKEIPEQSVRFYPSGGARYPIEIYFYFKGNDTIPCGIYHYNVKHHYLEGLPVADAEAEVKSLATYPFAYDAAAFFFLTAVFNRSMHKYKERGYRFTLFEAGCMLHNFYLVAETLHLGCCGIGSTFDDEVAEILDLDVRIEYPVLSFVAGHVKHHKVSSVL